MSWQLHFINSDSSEDMKAGEETMKRKPFILIFKDNFIEFTARRLWDGQ